MRQSTSTLRKAVCFWFWGRGRKRKWAFRVMHGCEFLRVEAFERAKCKKWESATMPGSGGHSCRPKSWGFWGLSLLPISSREDMTKYAPSLHHDNLTWPSSSGLLPVVSRLRFRLVNWSRHPKRHGGGNGTAFKLSRGGECRCQMQLQTAISKTLTW